MFLINGYKQESLAVSDRATQFGDGCFTTARVIDVKSVCYRRISSDYRMLGQRLMISCDFWPQLEQEMKTLAAEQQNGVLKVVISRGSGGRGYSTLNSGPATRILSVTAYPAHYDRLRNEGMTLALSPVRLGRNPHLAGIKHLNRLEQVLIRSHLEQTNADEALVLDSEGWVTECCAANLFWRKGNVVYTPRLDQAGVNGIMRQFCIRLLAQSSYQLVEVQASLEEALQADEMVICNALMPVMPVRACGDVSFSSATLYEYLAPLCERPN
ncbi:4-amino-4-deoxychorismate lyase [Escherichia coli]|uniref:Aminodeoxychorismate lyase n=1 Tax=Escherichia coli TaxID=562 RepID=A0A2X3JZ86_ECOLX|nr:4-amino-4-deoxychorismate lyase [Escherichia coli]